MTLVCGACRACCLIESGVVLHPEAGDDPALYDVAVGDDGLLRIAPRAKGKGCRYLGPKGCMIYDRRPSECRAFDCRKMAAGETAGMGRAERRRHVAQHPYREIIRAGFDRMRGAAA